MTVEIKEISKRSSVETAEDDLPANLKSAGVSSEIDYLKRLKLRTQIMANLKTSGNIADAKHRDEIAIAGFKSAEDARIEKYYGKSIILYNSFSCGLERKKTDTTKKRLHRFNRII